LEPRLLSISFALSTARRPDHAGDASIGSKVYSVDPPSHPSLRCSKMNARKWPLVVFAVSLLTLSLLAFHSKLPLLFYRFDGTYLLYVATMQKVWSIGGWNIGSNPLQGIGGMDLPWRALLDPGLWLVGQLPSSIAQIVTMT